MDCSICKIDCSKCQMQSDCGGCIKTGGKPFGEDCTVALCHKNNIDPDEFKAKLMKAFNSLEIEGMGKVDTLVSLKGSFVNLDLKLPNGQTAKFLSDNKIYLGYQLPKEGSDRLYGIAADERILLVCEYGENGADAELTAFKRWN